MQPKIKIPFIIAPLFFVLGWGLFIYNTYDIINVMPIVILVLFITFAIILLQKTYPVISDNTHTAIFFFLLTFYPISYQQTIMQLFASLLFLLFIFITAHYTKSLKALANSGLLSGIIFLFQRELGLFLIIYNIVFIYFIFPSGKRIKPTLLFLLTTFEIVFIYYMINYVWDIEITPIKLVKLHYTSLLNIAIGILFIISIPLSTHNFFKFKVNRRNHISFANIANLITLSFYFATQLPIFILFFLLQLSLIVYFQEKNSNTVNTIFKIAGIIYSLLYVFLQIKKLAYF